MSTRASHETAAIGHAVTITRTSCLRSGFTGGPDAPDGLAWRLGSGRPGRDAGGDHGQFGIGARGERLAHPRVEVVLGQPGLCERGLEHVDHLLAVGV